MFSGSICALVTPFHQEGGIDHASVTKLCRWHLQQGTHGLVVAGTTGEGLLLRVAEKKALINTVKQAVGTALPIILGINTAAIQDAVDQAQLAEQWGVDGLLINAPAYLKPSQEGLYNHFLHVSQHTSLPIILYDNPARAVVTLSNEIITRLAERENIIALKDAGPLIIRPAILKGKMKADFSFLAGNDDTSLLYLAAGGQGGISAIANVRPDLCAGLYNAWNAGDIVQAQTLFQQLLLLYQILFAEPSPGPIKYALSRLIGINPEMRLPFMPISEGLAESIEQIMVNLPVMTAGYHE